MLDILHLTPPSEGGGVWMLEMRSPATECLRGLLQMPPEILYDAPYPDITSTGTEDEEMMETVLQEWRSESQAIVRKLIEAPPDAKNKITVSLSGEEVECLVATLNRIRLGLWVALGSPDPLPCTTIADFFKTPSDPRRKALVSRLDNASVLLELFLAQIDPPEQS